MTPAEESSDTNMPYDMVSLAGPLRGDRALEELLAPSATQGEDAELCLNAHLVDSIDVVGATATRMRIHRHLREHPRGNVAIWLPQDAAVAARFYDMLRPLPDRVDVGEVPKSRAAAHFTLLPATLITDSEDAQLAGEVVLDACINARIARPRAGYITEATMELADNAVIHAGDAADPAVVAVSSFGRPLIVEIAVTDAGEAISEAENSLATLGAIPGRALSGERGFLGLILNKGRSAGVDVTVRIAAGTGRLLWTPTQHRTGRERYVAGTTVVARVGA
jgi:anti-sigma regulatory factor (Ser/Thr protein kinase)